MNLFSQWGRSAWYWLAMTVFAVAAEVIALYYQYGLDQYPCVLCIHVRLWVAALAIAGLIGVLLRSSSAGRIIAALLAFIAAIGFVERSWQTLAIEKGWIIELACPMDAGLPSWFDLENWIPAVFKVQASCGLSPMMPFGITMAEALMGISIVAVIVTGLVLAAAVLRR